MISSSLSVNGKSFELTKDYLNNNGNYSSEIPFSEVVFAGYGIVDDKIDNYKDLDVRGKAVLVIEGAPLIINLHKQVPTAPAKLLENYKAPRRKELLPY